jgi:hypothetical protein
MDQDLGRVFEGRKFLWDGLIYAGRAEAESRAQAYRSDGFEVRLVEQEGKFLLYTRRTVKQAAAA